MITVVNPISIRGGGEIGGAPGWLIRWWAMRCCERTTTPMLGAMGLMQELVTVSV